MKKEKNNDCWQNPSDFIENDDKEEDLNIILFQRNDCLMYEGL